jgi:hypothetical protein
MGLLGRTRKIRSLYCVYYCSNILNTVLCLLLAAWPLSLIMSQTSYCRTAEAYCKHVDAAAACPYKMAPPSLAVVTPGLPAQPAPHATFRGGWMF